LHAGDLDGRAIDLGGLAESRKEFQRAVVRRTAERFADQILRRLDRTAGLHCNRKGRLVEHDIDRARSIVRLFRRQFDQGVDVAEADVIGAVGDQRHGGARAVALVDGDVEIFGFEIAEVLREEEHPLRALIFPVQNKLELSWGLRRREGRCRAEHSQAAQNGKDHRKQRIAARPGSRCHRSCRVGELCGSVVLLASVVFCMAMPTDCGSADKSQ
jgi:hypothetical protein